MDDVLGGMEPCGAVDSGPGSRGNHRRPERGPRAGSPRRRSSWVAPTAAVAASVFDASCGQWDAPRHLVMARLYWRSHDGAVDAGRASGLDGGARDPPATHGVQRNCGLGTCPVGRVPYCNRGSPAVDACRPRCSWVLGRARQQRRAAIDVLGRLAGRTGRSRGQLWCSPCVLGPGLVRRPAAKASSSGSRHLGVQLGGGGRPTTQHNRARDVHGAARALGPPSLRPTGDGDRPDSRCTASGAPRGAAWLR
mmetsp:Transcript_21049/g.54791  ORF Transcript_21049/g.54791 Transcript_21049/m.54791 type:complete len:251 (+) Transcript_21049:436-1188(+)